MGYNRFKQKNLTFLSILVSCRLPGCRRSRHIEQRKPWHLFVRQCVNDHPNWGGLCPFNPDIIAWIPLFKKQMFQKNFPTLLTGPFARQLQRPARALDPAATGVGWKAVPFRSPLTLTECSTHAVCAPDAPLLSCDVEMSHGAKPPRLRPQYNCISTAIRALCG
jgi:hypothetical protein